MLLAVSVGFAADYLFNLALGKTLPAHEYGDYKVAYAFALIAGTLVLLGGDRVAPRILSAPLSRGDNRLAGAFFKFYLLIIIILSTVLILATTSTSSLNFGSAQFHYHHPIALMSFVIPLIAIGSLLSRVLQSAKLIAYSNLPWRIVFPLVKTALVILLAVMAVRIHLWHVIAISATVVSLIVIWQWYKVRQYALLSFEQAGETLERRQMLRLSVPMMLAMLITLALNHLDLFMLELLGDEKEVGYFAAAATTAHLIPVAQATIAVLFLPLIAPAMESGNQAARAMFLRGQKFITIAVVVLTLFILLAGKWLLSLFGDGFQQAQQVLVYLAFGYALWALTAFCSTWLQYSSMGLRAVLTGCTALIINVSLNLWLIPLYGMHGAAVATLVSMGIAAGILGIIYFRYVYLDLMS